MCEKEGREERRDIFEEYVLKEKKETVADRHNAKLFNICVHSVYVL